MASLFDEIGGATVISAIVDDFYRRVLSDPSLRRYFASTDMFLLKGHQRAFLTAALGGPDEYAGRSMREAHAMVGVTESDFDTVAGHLFTTLVLMDVPKRALGQVAVNLAEIRAQIIRRPDHPVPKPAS